MTEDPSAVRFDLRTPMLTDSDACLRWLKLRHTHFPSDSDGHLARLENDLSACAAHRWSAFSHPSPPHAAAPLIPHGLQRRPVECHIGADRVTIGSAVIPKGQEEAQRTAAEPSRHVFTRAVKQREAIALSSSIAAAGGPRGPLRRAELGGYIFPSSAHTTRFLIFPQRLHDARLNGSCPQEFQWALRGTVARHNGYSDEEQSAAQQLLRDTAVNVSFAKKFASSSSSSSTSSTSSSSSSSLSYSSKWSEMCAIDAMRVDAYMNQRHTERTLLSDGATVRAADICGTGVTVHFSGQDPRHSFSIGPSYTVAREEEEEAEKNKKEKEKEKEERGEGQPIAALAFAHSYDSAVQRFSSPLLRQWLPRANYRVACTGLSGVEYTTGDTPWTLFGRLCNTSWLELPLRSRLFLRLRHQSACVFPFAWPTHSQSESAESHRLFWATQGPRWEPHLVRGFADALGSTHHARRWYALFSAEFVSKRPTGEGQWRRPHGMIYANACLADSLAHPPRASVGFSLEGNPRQTANVFNAIIPSVFECSINWRVHFNDNGIKLVSGVSQGTSAEEAVVRISPLESFRHIRCGLTWKL